MSGTVRRMARKNRPTGVIIPCAFFSSGSCLFVGVCTYIFVFVCILYMLVVNWCIGYMEISWFLMDSYRDLVLE